MVDSKEVITLTTASDLLKTTNIVLPKKGITLFGHPVYDSQQGDSMTSGGVKDVRKDKYADLPGTETEVRHIKSSLEKHGIQTDMFLGKEASEENLKDHSPKGILHISTHGFFIHYDDDVNSLFGSGLILAGANDPIGSHREDGILNSYEASLLNLKDVDLVVLSACETGLGELKGGEGVYGLQRAFKSAGVTYAIMSLWKVDDVATEKMMSVFYEELSQMNGVRESFVKAQEQIKQTYPEPYYWGAFVLIGY